MYVTVIVHKIMFTLSSNQECVPCSAVLVLLRSQDTAHKLAMMIFDELSEVLDYIFISIWSKYIYSLKMFYRVPICHHVAVCVYLSSVVTVKRDTTSQQPLMYHRSVSTFMLVQTFLFDCMIT